MALARPGPSRRLPRGPYALNADAVATEHRRRLHAAATELVGQQGYGATTGKEMADRAQVSTRDFYALFGGKEQLVLDACDAAIAAACGPLRALPAPGGDLRDALATVLSGVVDAVLADVAGARLALVEVSAVGPAGLLRRQTLNAGLRDLLRQAATVDGTSVMSEASLSVLAAGTLHVLHRHLRSGHMRSLRSAAQDLASWGAMYEVDRPRPLPPRDPQLDDPIAAPLPAGRQRLPTGLIRVYQRERVLAAVLQMSAQQGFESTSVKDLQAAANIAPKVFYDNFSSKQDAWSAAFDDALAALYLPAWRAAHPQPDPAAQVAAALDSALRHLASEPQRARLLLVDAVTAGRAAAAEIDEALGIAERLLSEAVGTGMSSPVLIAMAGGIADLAGSWVTEERTAQLPDLVAPLVEVILTPALGLTAAARAADTTLDDPAPGTQPDDRRLLMEALAETVARIGLPATRMADVTEAAGIELDVARSLFTDELDCATKALDDWAGRLVIIAAGAFLGAAGDPPLAAHRALQAALDHIAANAAIAALAVADDPQLARAATTLRDRYVALFFELIAGQVPVTEQRAPQPLSALEIVLDGLLGTLRSFAQQNRITDLPDELPALSLRCLTPFFGADEARRAAHVADAAHDH